jgi:hypothetical protein
MKRIKQSNFKMRGFGVYTLNPSSQRECTQWNCFQIHGGQNITLCGEELHMMMEGGRGENRIVRTRKRKQWMKERKAVRREHTERKTIGSFGQNI